MCDEASSAEKRAEQMTTLNFLKRQPFLEHLELRIPYSQRPLNRVLVLEGEGFRIISAAAMDHSITETDDSAGLSKTFQERNFDGEKLGT